jgi:sensitive to high expression protein 9
MSLIRSEHINDQAIRQAKESVLDAEAALEEARAQLEKRERAQYHEEQIWSDTIRRNSTWVTFGLMGLNIFLLLLSLAILEPWRRRRMVREIKSALVTQLEAQKLAAPVSLVPAVTASTAQQDLAAIEEEIDMVNDATAQDIEAATPAMLNSAVENTPVAKPTESTFLNAGSDNTEPLVSAVDPTLGVAAPTPALQDPRDVEVPTRRGVHIVEGATDGKPTTWQGKVSAVAQDIVSDQVISMRRIDYTSAILQGAAAGAIITAAFIGILRPS